MGFNSQRDGILRTNACCGRLEPKQVSIPNGMEFYPDRPHRRFGIVSVSILNGMKFYYAPILSWRKIPSFNSQGDRLPAQFILINKVLDLPRQIYLAEARNLPRRINSAEFYFTLFISISPSRAPISIRSPALISSLRIISAILSSTRS